MIFDLDGLLADTEVLHCQAYVTALAEVGVRLTDVEYEDHWVRRGLGIVDLCRERALSIDPLVTRARKFTHYQTLVQRAVRAMPGALEIVHALRPTYALAVGTSSTRESALLVLNQLGLEFEVVVTADDVARIKPSPDIFLEAARRLGTPPSNCVVFEDAEKGIIAAHAAGIKSIAVPNRHTLTHDFSLASRVVNSLPVLSPSYLDELFARS